MFLIGILAAWRSTWSFSTAFSPFASLGSRVARASISSLRSRLVSPSQGSRKSHQSLHAFDGTSDGTSGSIDWLEPLDPKGTELEASDGMVLPVFPLGGPFMPYSKHKLNIFEPRSLTDRMMMHDHTSTSISPLSDARTPKNSNGSNDIC